ncbi:Pycsar system effector family protein [Streptomyces melanogenes]|uniref:Pycsar system effector family protein n=1 Tax=Streptomyces melanogenes TaxID=67326 RepID=UPI003797A84E
MTADPLTRPAPQQPPAAPGTEAATRLLADVRAEIARADSKASVLVAALGITAGVVSGLLAGCGWSPGSLSRPGAVTWWGGTFLLALALLALLMAVMPRIGADGWTPGTPLSYFGDIRQAVRQGRLAQALVDTDRAPAASLIAALTQTSRIAARKHQWIRGGLLAFCAGAVLLSLSRLIG